MALVADIKLLAHLHNNDNTGDEKIRFENLIKMLSFFNNNKEELKNYIPILIQRLPDFQKQTEILFEEEIINYSDKNTFFKLYSDISKYKF